MRYVVTRSNSNRFHRTVTVLLAALLLLVACNNSGVPEPTKRIMIWHSWEGQEAALLDSMIDNYVSINPDAEVVQMVIPPDELKDQYIELAKLGLGPDLFIGDSTWVRELTEAGIIRSLDEKALIDPATYLPTALETVRYQDKLYGLPLLAITDVLYYNTRQVDEPATTLDQLLIQADEGKISAIDSDFNRAAWGIQAFGGRLFDETGRLMLDQGGFANWLGWLNSAATNPNVIVTNEREALEKLFTTEQAAYYVGSTNQLAELKASLGNEVVGLSILPAGPGGPAGPLMRTEALLLNANSSVPQANVALDLAQFLTNAQQQTELVRQLQRVPVNIGVRINDRVHPAVGSMIDQSKTGVPIPNLAQMEELQVAGNRAYIEVFSGASNSDQAASSLTAYINDKYGFEPEIADSTLACPTQRQGRLELWHSWDQAGSKSLADIIRDFRQRCPGVQVSLTHIPSNALRSRFETEANRPDLLLAPSQWLAGLAGAGLIGDLTDRITPPALQTYTPIAQETVRYQERLYALPLSLRVIGLFYRPEAVAVPAATLTQLLDSAGPETKVTIPVTFDEAFWGFSAFGGLFLDEAQQFQLDGQAVQGWLAWLQTAQQEPGVLLGQNYEALENEFGNGSAAYLVGRSNSLSLWSEASGSRQVAATRLPFGPEGGPRSFVTSHAVMVNVEALASEAQAELALTLAQFLTSAESQTLLLAQTQHLPSNINVDMSDSPTASILLQEARDGLARPNSIYMDDLSARGDALFREVLFEERDPAEAVAEFLDLLAEFNQQSLTGGQN